MNCKKCGKEGNIFCLCGICPKCNGIDKKMKEDFQKFLSSQEEVKK